MIQTQDRETVQDAEGRIQRVLAQDPGNEDALFDFAATQTQLGRPEEAEKYLDNILEKSPGNLKSAIAFAQIKLSKKDFKAAEGVMMKFTDQYPNSPDAAIALGVVYAATGNFDSAEVQFRRALRLSPQNAAALTALRSEVGTRYRAEVVEALAAVVAARTDAGQQRRQTDRQARQRGAA